MASYNELVKNFEKIRLYMQEFYVYGLKSREEYTNKSARSYDDERRRIESWLAGYTANNRSEDGKSVYIAIDSRSTMRNPLYNAWKTKSFTDGDVTLHFIIFDILQEGVSKTINEIISIMDEEYLSYFNNPKTFDESTVRKKLNEYVDLGLLVKEKLSRNSVYRRSETIVIDDYDVLKFFSEVAPLGVIGSYLLDKYDVREDAFLFKHHYITNTLDSEVLLQIFRAIEEKREIEVINKNIKRAEGTRERIVPLKVYVSAQNGREHVVAYIPLRDTIRAYRLDYLSDIRFLGEVEEYDYIREKLRSMSKYTWGVNFSSGVSNKKLESVHFTIKVNSGEEHIVKRLIREKRGGKVEKVGNNTYKFSILLYDSGEIIPWIRTFICRIVDLSFSNKAIERRFKNDIKRTYSIYGV